MNRSEKKTGPSGTDLRKSVRIVSKNLVRIRATGSADPDSISNIFDLSEGGVRALIHSKPPAIGTLYHVTLNLAEQQRVLAVKAALRWSTPWKERRGSYFVGLQFLNLASQEKEALLRYLEGVGGAHSAA